VSFIAQFSGALRFALVNMGWIFVTLWGVERLWARDPVPESAQLRALGYWACYAVGGATTVAAFAAFAQTWHLRPAFTVPLNATLKPIGWLALIVGPLVFAAIYDFFNYWMHRAQHRWFWAQHSIHHSIRNLSGVNSYLHWTEDAFRTVFITLPMTLLFGLDGGKSSLAVAMALSAWGNFLHSPVRFNFGRFGRMLFADNVYHRVHHSVEPEHFDKNFATAFTVWDRLFGTQYLPARGEWPAVGVHDMPEVSSVGEYLWRPFLHQAVETDDRSVDECVG
jgi:sterol desaturase/sphingolipid hydroxylase (fatty acid hydroxylase superfamily)